MKIIFFGSDDFAVLPLQTLIQNGYKISCVVTQPDRKKGRRLSLSETAVKQAAEKFNLRIFQPERINSFQAQESLESQKADLFIVIAYGQILSQKILDIPEIFCINLHASLLPKYRGAAPINWAIINGETKTGVTVMKLERKMDAGPVILQREMAIGPRDSALTLAEKLSGLGSGALLEALGIIKDGKYRLTQQDEALATFAPKLAKADGRINWGKSAAEVDNLIRGTAGWPGAFTSYRGKMLKVIEAAVEEAAPPQGVEPGRIAGVSSEGIVVSCASGALAIKKLQMEGRRAMGAADFLSGHKIPRGEILE
ncbi:MAG: methionyl-tRNA formyltransferase [Candidatus Omnitrophota bacterium]|nr:methionyl-tRNA formyltransferase [Candidatus Omnitrophota bacterium]